MLFHLQFLGRAVKQCCVASRFLSHHRIKFSCHSNCCPARTSLLMEIQQWTATRSVCVMGDFTGCYTRLPHKLGRRFVSICFSSKTDVLLNHQHPDSPVVEEGKGEDWQQGCSQPQLFFTNEVMKTELCRAQLCRAAEKTNFKHMAGQRPEKAALASQPPAFA